MLKVSSSLFVILFRAETDFKKCWIVRIPSACLLVDLSKLFHRDSSAAHDTAKTLHWRESLSSGETWRDSLKRVSIVSFYSLLSQSLSTVFLHSLFSQSFFTVFLHSLRSLFTSRRSRQLKSTQALSKQTWTWFSELNSCGSDAVLIGERHQANAVKLARAFRCRCHKPDYDANVALVGECSGCIHCIQSNASNSLHSTHLMHGMNFMAWSACEHLFPPCLSACRH